MQFKEGSVFPHVKYKGIGRCPFPYRRVSPLPPPCPLTLLRIQKGNNNPAGGGWPHVVPLGGGWLACFASLHLDPSTTLTAAVRHAPLFILELDTIILATKLGPFLLRLFVICC